MMQELWQDYPQLPRLHEVAALYTDHIQKPAKSPDYLFGVVTQPSKSWLTETKS